MMLGAPAALNTEETIRSSLLFSGLSGTCTARGVKHDIISRFSIEDGVEISRQLRIIMPGTFT
jgi:hypothetical protein